MAALRPLRIGIDLDDVCIEFIRTLIDAYNTLAGDNSLEPVAYEDFDQWNLITPYGGPLDFPSYGSLWEWVTDEVLDDWAAAPEVRGALDSLCYLAEQGHHLVCITAKATEHKRVAYEAIAYHQFPFHEVHVTDDKVSVPRCDVYIDDSPKHLEALTEAFAPDSLVIRFERPWNRPGDGTATAGGWGEAVALIKNYQKPTHEVLGIKAPPDEDDEETRITDALTGGQKGQKLAALGSIDPVALLELAKVSGYGAQKYARYNYLKGYDWSLSFDALQRHLLEFWSGEDYDKESGRLHVAHAGWHCAALTSFVLRGLGTDDRFKTSQ